MESGTGDNHNGSAVASSGKAGVKTRLPPGNGFMPQVRRSRLVKMARKAGEGVEKSRLLAARMRKEGKSIRDIADRLCRPYSTVRDWLFRMHVHGLKGQFNRKRRGRKGVLSNADLKRPRRWLVEGPEKHGFKSDTWQLDTILEMIRMRTGMACRQRTVERALRKIRFSYRKRRPAPHNSASEGEQERFKAETNARLEGLRKDSYAVFAEDEGTFQLSPANCYGWRPTNGHDTVPTSFSKKSVKVFCAVGENELNVRPADAANSDEFADALKELHGKHPKFVMVLDNASYHKSHTVRKYLEAIKRDPQKGIELIFLPPHTPQLNPVEIQLRELKKRRAGRHFGSADDLKRMIVAMVDSGEARPVKLMDYLLPEKDALHTPWNLFINGQIANCT